MADSDPWFGGGHRGQTALGIWYHDTIPFYEYDDIAIYYIVHKDSRVWWPLWARSPKAGYASAGQPTNTKYSNNKREREKKLNNQYDRQDVYSDLPTNTKYSKNKTKEKKIKQSSWQAGCILWSANKHQMFKRKRRGSEDWRGHIPKGFCKN